MKQLNTNSIPVISVFFLVICPSLVSCDNMMKNNTRPNIVFILADDLGYMDVCSYAHHVLGTSIDSMFYETPHIDKLAAEGLSFSNAYVCPLSSPTRSSLLTGKYAFHMGITTAMPMRDTWYMLNKPVPPGEYVQDVLYHGDPITIEQALINGKSNSAIPAGLPIDSGRYDQVISEVLSLKGYHTAFIGKWHVGGFGAKGYQPKDRGFDEVPAYADAGGSVHFNWRKHWNNPTNTKGRWPNMPQQRWSLGDSGEKSDKNFLTDDLTDKALKYLDAHAKNQRKPFFLYFCQFAVHAPIQARVEDIRYFEGKKTKGWNRQGNAIYAGLIRSLDDSVGKIMNKLKETGLDKNTILIFLSDNGGIDGKITNHPENSITNNSPFIGGKATLFEGGIKSPLIFSWKGHIKSGNWCNVPVDASDIYPTLLELSKINPRPFYKKQKLDGRSFYPLLNDPENKKKEFDRNVFYWHYPFNVIYNNPVDGLSLTPHSAIRVGDMKLIYDWYGRLYLFDLNNDPYESHNIASQKPLETKRLFGQLVEMLDTQVEKRYLPTENPAYNPAKESRKGTPYVNLIKCYKKGDDLMQVATFPDMSKRKIK